MRKGGAIHPQPHGNSCSAVPKQEFDGKPQQAREETQTCGIDVQDGPADDLIPSPEETPGDNLSDVELDEDDAAANNKEMLPDYILGQYELVKRIKNRWKCTLNHVVMHLNGQDVVVTKAQGELTF